MSRGRKNIAYNKNDIVITIQWKNSSLFIFQGTYLKHRSFLQDPKVGISALHMVSSYWGGRIESHDVLGVVDGVRWVNISIICQSKLRSEILLRSSELLGDTLGFQDV